MISLDRYFQVRYKNWRRSYFKGNRPTYSAILLFIFALLFNSNVLFLYGYSEETFPNQTVYYCYEIPSIPSTRWMKIWGNVNLKLINDKKTI